MRHRNKLAKQFIFLSLSLSILLLSSLFFLSLSLSLSLTHFVHKTNSFAIYGSGCGCLEHFSDVNHRFGFVVFIILGGARFEAAMMF
jgi:hypothetical protein